MAFRVVGHRDKNILIIRERLIEGNPDVYPVCLPLEQKCAHPELLQSSGARHRSAHGNEGTGLRCNRSGLGHDRNQDSLFQVLRPDAPRCDMLAGYFSFADMAALHFSCPEM